MSGFSVAGKRIIEDERNQLYKSFVAIVAHFKPKAFVMENVPNILSMGDGIIKQAIFKDFESLGYNVQCQVLMASDYGVPQNRRRAVFVGMLEGQFDFDIPTVKHKVTTSEALSDLPEGSLPDGNIYPIDAESDFQKLIRINSNGVFNHEVTEHNQKTVDVISLVPDGGNYKNLPESLQGIRKVHIAWTRLNSKAPSITIDTGHRHHFHYKWNRVPTVRESARIQSFPDSFDFDSVSQVRQYKAIGNAVPPVMMWHVANTLAKSINNNSGKGGSKAYKFLDKEPHSGEWIQLSLFEPKALYYSKKNRGTLITYCSKTNSKKIAANMQFRCQIVDADIEGHPELLSINRICLHNGKEVVGYYIVESVGLDKDGVNIDKGSKILVYSLEGTNEQPTHIDFEDVNQVK